MKKTISTISAFLLAFIFVFSFASCAEKTAEADIWTDAIYLEDKEFGNGAKTVQVKVVAEEKSVTFTLHTDKDNLGDALIEHNLITGEDGPYGLYIKTVNGILADYDVNQTYWALNKNGEASMTGVDGTPIADGEHYELVCTNG
ncbi:MAG: DUF4430 domain-containing protein [Clostridia bacterium]|nr:DUF4430 domain-containing protein [Clostridia bacterium]